MAIVKQEMSDWPGIDEKMTPRNNLKLRLSKTSLDIVRGFLF